MHRFYFLPGFGGSVFLLVLAICFVGIVLTYGVDFLYKKFKKRSDNPSKIDQPLKVRK